MKLVYLSLLFVTLLPACTTGYDGASHAAPSSPTYVTGSLASELTSTERKIRKDGSLSMKSRTLEKSSRKCVALVEAHHGTFQSSSLTEENYKATIRIPSHTLEPLMDSLSEVGRVTYRCVGADDVTEQYHDLEAKLKNMRALRNRLHQLLEKSETIKDTLDIEKELVRVQTELDQLEGRMKLLRSQVTQSTLNLSIAREQISGPLGAVGKGASWMLKKLFVIR